jgi:hypothetical protein
LGDAVKIWSQTGSGKLSKFLAKSGVKIAKSGQRAGLTGSWAGPSGVPSGLAPVRLPLGLDPVRAGNRWREFFF